MNQKITRVQIVLDGIQKIFTSCCHYDHYHRGKFILDSEPGDTWIICREGTTRVMLPCKYHLYDYLENGVWKIYE